MIWLLAVAALAVGFVLGALAGICMLAMGLESIRRAEPRSRPLRVVDGGRR